MSGQRGAWRAPYSPEFRREAVRQVRDAGGPIRESRASSLHKLDTLVRALVDMRAGVIEEGHLYRERQAEVDSLNATLR
jgi:transposase-like protein